MCLSCTHIRTKLILIGVPNLQLMGIFNSGTNDINIIVTWDAANSPYCGGVLYYIVMISSDNIIIDTVNVTDLTVTFHNLRNDTNYDVTVTAYNRVGTRMNTTVTESIRIFPPITTQPPSNSNVYFVILYIKTHDSES